MQVFQKILPLKQHLRQSRLENQSLGLVPTMGALHKGHFRLIETSVNQNDLTVCTIFVNPEQFNDPDDLLNYPRNMEADLKLIESAGADIVFSPDVDEIYPDKPVLSMDFGSLDKVLEGTFRKDHFKGVGLVVSKLLNIVDPDKAYFGQKDFQQLAIIKRLVKDLSFHTQIISVPTVREDDGLAFSSRNLNLTPEERLHAPVLYKCLKTAREKLLEGENMSSVKLIISSMCNVVGIDLEYFEAVNAHTLEFVNKSTDADEIVLCTAARLGKVRLIDNMPLFD